VLLKVDQQRSTAKVKLIFIKAEKYNLSTYTLETPKVVLLGLILAERE
jgi:hypothetical protein